MKLKSIRPTNEYKHIKFGQLKDDWVGRSVLSPLGFQPILRFEFIKNGPSCQLDLSNGQQLICDPKHIVATSDGPRFAKDLSADDKLLGYNLDITSTKTDGPTVDLYDIEIPDPHWYYTAGVVSHNSLAMGCCANKAAQDGHNVLLITFELSGLKTAIRLASGMSNTATKDFIRPNADDLSSEERQELRQKQRLVGDSIRAKRRGDLVIYDLPAGECSVNDVYGIIETNKKLHGWTPKVVILDYLELMISRRGSNNDNGDYSKQKEISNEVCGLAKKENVLVITANQGNRSSVDTARGNAAPAHINLDKSAESYGKNMPVDYVISMNQTEEEYRGEDGPSTIRFWIAKNRNGPKFISIPTTVFYGRSQILEVQ